MSESGACQITCQVYFVDPMQYKLQTHYILIAHPIRIYNIVNAL